MALLEIACFSADHALRAFNSGADRIEFCNDREAGGTTPTFEDVQMVKRNVNIPVFVMIRPRGGDFNYDEDEFEQMERDVDRFTAISDGFVFGILNDDLTIDIARTIRLVQRAAPLPCTFHRAFDETVNQRTAFEDVVATGCQAVLSSGGAPNAVSGASMLRELVLQARNRIVVIPGGGVRANNLLELHGYTKASAYHSSGIVNGLEDPDPSEIRRMKMLLREQPLAPLASIQLGERLHARPSPDGNGGGEKQMQVHVAAVSIGASTPVDELNKRLR
jgi:copper homeostasis protein